MAILWQDGFDLYTTNVADLLMSYNNASANSISLTGGRFGAGGVKLQYYGLSWPIPSPSTEYWLGYAFNLWSVGSNDNHMAQFRSAATPNGGVEGSLTYNASSGVWKLWRGYAGTLLGMFTLNVSTGWHWLDVHYKMHGTTGVFEVWVDNVQMIVLTGQNTIQNSGQTALTSVCISDGTGSGGEAMWIDDAVITDTTGSVNMGRIGDSRIETLVPTSNAGPNQGAPSSGSAYSCVNEAQWNTSNYVTMASSGNKEVYGHGALAGTPPVVHAVAIKMVSEKSDAGGFSLEPLVVSNSVEADGSAQALTTSWGVQNSVFEIDPNTSAAWTYSAVNAANIGFKVP